MSDFMKPYTLCEEFIEYEWRGETQFVPADIIGILPSDIVIVERYHDKWFARLSAPGYLDCTEWQGPYDTEEEALADLIDTFDLEEAYE